MEPYLTLWHALLITRAADHTRQLPAAMLPRLSIPNWQPSADGGAGGEDATPRDAPSMPPSSLPLRPAGSLPSSPSARKTKSRAARNYLRTDSLKDAKVRVPP